MAKRSVASWNVDVQRSAEETFAYLLDVSKHGEWSPKPFTVEGLSAGPVTQGATFTSYGVIPRSRRGTCATSMRSTSGSESIRSCRVGPIPKNYFVENFSAKFPMIGSLKYCRW